MKESKYEYGMIGLGTMGQNLVFNMNDHGYSVIGFDKKTSQVDAMNKEAGDKKVFATSNLDEFLKGLKSPKVIMMLVPAGKIVDDVINELKPHLSKDDLLMDCGNSHFTDTNRRIAQLQDSGIYFMGVGISGGELGARNGPSIMPGGSEKIYDRVAKMLEDISAKVNNEPCVTWLGPGSAGHYVKMVHNGIEYGIMQLISEVYHIMKKCGGLNNDEIHAVFSKWNQGKLQSYLIEITANIFTQKDEFSDNRIIDLIVDSAKQKGTGAWTSEDAMHLQVPIPVIDIAVSMRDLSALRNDRDDAHSALVIPENKFDGDKNELVKWLEDALYFSIITTYAQGMALLQAASDKYNYNLNVENIAAIWRGGCIIRAALLEDIRTAFLHQPKLSNLMWSETFSKKFIQSQTDLRKVIQTGVEYGIPIPAMMGALGYFDSYRSGWLPANLIMAQRDNFGAHTYERTDREGTFHTQWNQIK
ncbi:MAG: NADP-dependent phosphogluconate dehydrogenase [Chitinophagales bacterium]|nr:NADP-dependent phosphogluconate dehydrogenase [Chitinophagales bacterium]